MNLFIVFVLVLVFGCKKDDDIAPIDDVVVVDDDVVIDDSETSEIVDYGNGDPLAIVAGKAMSFAASNVDECAYTPPGKWVNSYGSTYLRYVERGEGTEKEDISGSVKVFAEGVASVLTEDQMNTLLENISEQTSLELEALENRDLIARELYKWRQGTAGDESHLMELGEKNGRILYDLLTQRTEDYGSVVQNLTADQKESLALVRTNEYTEATPDDLEAIKASLSSEDERARLTIMLYKFLSWSTGTEAMNRFIDDGRPAVFFGFANLRVENITGEDQVLSLRKDASDLFLNILNTEQTDAIKNLVSEQADVLEGHFESRRVIGSGLMGYQKSDGMVNLDELLETCIESERNEVELAILQAKRMSEIILDLSDEQLQKLIDFKEG